MTTEIRIDETMTIADATSHFGACSGARCEDGFYTVEGPQSDSLSAAIQPWRDDEVQVRVLADGLVGWGSYTHFLRVESLGGQPVCCLMAAAK